MVVVAKENLFNNLLGEKPMDFLNDVRMCYDDQRVSVGGYVAYLHVAIASNMMVDLSQVFAYVAIRRSNGYESRQLSTSIGVAQNNPLNDS